MKLPLAFTESMKERFSTEEMNSFTKALEKSSPTSIRLHPIKYKSAEYPDHCQNPFV